MYKNLIYEKIMICFIVFQCACPRFCMNSFTIPTRAIMSSLIAITAYIIDPTITLYGIFPILTISFSELKAHFLLTWMFMSRGVINAFDFSIPNYFEYSNAYAFNLTKVDNSLCRSLIIWMPKQKVNSFRSYMSNST
jgi:hypothetical protein